MGISPADASAIGTARDGSIEHLVSGNLFEAISYFCGCLYAGVHSGWLDALPTRDGSLTGLVLHASAACGRCATTGRKPLVCAWEAL